MKLQALRSMLSVRTYEFMCMPVTASNAFTTGLAFVAVLVEQAQALDTIYTCVLVVCARITSTHTALLAINMCYALNLSTVVVCTQ